MVLFNKTIELCICQYRRHLFSQPFCIFFFLFPAKLRHYRGNLQLEEFTERSAAGWKALEQLTTAELSISRLLSLRRKFLYDLTVAESKENKDAIEEMER